MENIKIAYDSPVEMARSHVLFHHKNAQGWITLAKKEKSGSWKQYHYKPQELASELSNWLGNDVYFSQNTFYKPQRRIENIKQLRSLYVDIDCHVLNYNYDWVLGKLDLEIFGETLPQPNIIIFSGRGLVCIWLIDPVPAKVLPLWQAVQKYFCDQLMYVGADKKSIDATRVFRMAGSVNSKSGREVMIVSRHDFRYVLRDLQNEYLPELAPALAPAIETSKKPGRKPKIIHLHNVRSLHYSRLMDLARLVELRDYDVEGHRELFCFLYRYWSCCLTDDLEDSLQQMLEFNSEFKDPLPESEVIRATRSAEKAWAAKSDAKANEEAIAKGYPGAGYNLKNTTLIRWFDIQPEEQEHLRTIIDANEVRRRKRERDKKRINEKRRQKGDLTRAEYLEEQREKTEDKLWQLQQAMKRHPRSTNVKLAALLDVDEKYIRKLKKILENSENRTGSSLLY